MKIGVFDSGVGGITVLMELRRRLPSVRFVYLGDNANLPYGTKSPDQVRCLSVACAKRLKDECVDALIVACNTASSLALPAIRKTMGEIPVIGMVEPGVEAVLMALSRSPSVKRGPVLVLATRSTVRSHAYKKALKKRLGSSIRVIEQACPLLVPLIEEGWIRHPILDLTILEYVSPHTEYGKGVALLGCTHYPWIQAALSKALPGWKLINSAEAVVQILKERGIGNSITGRRPNLKTKWIFTDPTAIPEFARVLIKR